MGNRLNIAFMAIFALVFGSVVLVQPTLSAQAAGGGLAVSIRNDERSLAWVKSQGFDAWYGGECYSASNLVLTQNWAQAEPAAGCGVDNFQLFATGFLQAPATGQFHFRVIANDAFELNLNGKEVLKYWADSTGAGKTFSTTNAQAQNLVSGHIYPLSFFYRDFTKEAHFKVQWKYPGSGDFADIPVQYLDNSAADLLGATQQEVSCEAGIGLSPECPAYSPQEIFQIHGTEADGEYWLLVAGVATKVHMVMDPMYSVNSVSGFVQLMHIPSANGGGYTGLSSAGARFNYDSPLWTDDYLTLNADAGPSAMAAKRNTYNYTPLSKVMVIYRGAANFSLNSNPNNTWNQTYTVNTGDLQLANQGQVSDLAWVENVPSFASGKPAKYTFDNQVTQSESVVEPVRDGAPNLGVTTTSRSVKRVKLSIDQTRKNKLLGVLVDRKAFGSEPNKLAIQAPKTGTFAAVKNPYNEWYGFNFRGREWANSKTVLKMRWGFFSMGFQTTFSQIASDGRDWRSTYINMVGEQSPSNAYAPSACNDGGCGNQLQYSYYGPLSRFLALGGIGLQDANAAAYQPNDLNLTDVVLNNGIDLSRSNCPVGNAYYAPGVVSQVLLGYKCAYTATLYGQMPNPSLASVSAVSSSKVAGGFEVSWSAVAGATEYVFAHRKLGESWKATRIINPVTLSQFVAESGPGTYEFKVSARKFDSPISFSSSVPTLASEAVGVGLGGGDELLLANGETTLHLNSALTLSPLAISGITASGAVGLTVTVDSSSAVISSVSGLSTYSDRTNQFGSSSSITLTTASPTTTLYGTTTSIQAALDSITYQHLNPSNPVGSVKIEVFDAGTQSVKFNPSNQHYYKIVTTSGDVKFRDAYCQVKVKANHDGNSGGYDNCLPGTGRENHNGVPGYLATITSIQELNFITQSGLLNHLVANSSDDDVWIGATDLTSDNGAVDQQIRWTDLSPVSERDGLAHSLTGTGFKNSAIPGIRTLERVNSKYSLTLLKTSQAGEPAYVFANADSGGNEDVKHYLIEYSDENGKNPLYKSRTIRFALAPGLTNAAVSGITSKSATINFDIDPANSPASIEVSYSSFGSVTQDQGYAVVSPAVTDSAGAVSAALTGLLPFTTYSYTITVTNKGGIVTESGSLMTGPALAQPLALAASNITHNSAELGASVRANAGALTAINLSYSTNQNLSPATTSAIPVSGISGTVATPATSTITGLAPDTTYYYRTSVQNSVGTTTSEILSFRTAKDLSTIATQFDPSASSVVIPNQFEITANHPNVFPVDFNRSPAQDAMYASYTVKNTSGSKLEDLWVSLQDFTGVSVRPAFPGDTDQFVGDLAAGQSKTVYFFLKASGLTEVDQSHVVKLSQGQPGTDAASTSSSIVFSFDSVSDLDNSNSTIRDIRFNTSAPPLGGDFKLTTVGKLESPAAGTSFLFNPAANSSWPADSLRLNQIRLVFPNISATPSCPSVVIDLQLLSNTCYFGQDFEVTYNFKVIDTPSGALSLNPAVISGTTNAWNGTDLAKNPAVLVNLRPQQNLSVTTTVSNATTSSQQQISGVTYSQVTVEIEIENTSLRSSSLDRVLVDLEPSTKFDPNNSYLSINGTLYSVSATVIDTASNLVAIAGPIPAKAGDDVRLVLDVLVPVGSTDTVAVVGQIGDVQVGPTAGASTTATIEVNASGAISASATTSAVSPRIDAVSAANVFGTSATLKGKVSEGVAGVTISFRIGQTSDLSFNNRVVSASPYLASGASFETFEASLAGLTPGSTYYYQALYNGVPNGEIMSFTTLAEDKPFVGLSSQPLPVASICDESELACSTTVINPPVASCADCSLSYTISSGVLPPGMSLNTSSGVISGTPTGTGGNYPFTLTVTSTGSDPSASPTVASQQYNLVTQPATAEPKIQSPSAGNVSLDSAIITATANYVPNGDLIKLVVRYTDSNSVVQIILNEVITEGVGASNQLVSFDLKGLSASTTYSYQIIFGNQETEWFEFQTTATETVPSAASVAATEVTQIDNTTAEISATISNPLPGDAIGFVVGSNQALTDGKTYIAASSKATSEQQVSTQVSNLAPGNYFYRVLLGDGLSPLTYPFSVGISQNSSSGSNGFGAGVTPISSSSSPVVTKYKTVLKKFSYYFSPGSSKLSQAQIKSLLNYLDRLPEQQLGLKLTAVGWVSKPARANGQKLSLSRAQQVLKLVRGKTDATVRAVGNRLAKNASKSSRRVDVYVSYQIPEETRD